MNERRCFRPGRVITGRSVGHANVTRVGEAMSPTTVRFATFTSLRAGLNG